MATNNPWAVVSETDYSEKDDPWAVVSEVDEVKKERTKTEALSDGFNSFGASVNNTLKTVTDLAGTNNPVSNFLGDNAKTLQGNYSPAYREELKKQAAEKAALGEDASYLDRGLLAAKQVIRNPIEGIGEVAGNIAPMVVGGVAGLGAKGMAALSAAMGAGAVKGGIAEAIQNAPETSLMGDPLYAQMREAGASEQEAKAKLGEQRASYGEAYGKILLGGGIGAAVGRFGSVENAIANMGKGAAGQGIIKSIGKEVATEIPQEMTETYLGNTGAAAQGADIAADQGVIEAGVKAGILSAAGGAGAGLAGKFSTPVAKPEDIATAQSTDEAVDIFNEATSAPVAPLPTASDLSQVADAIGENLAPATQPEARPITEIQPDDILNGVGRPFTSMEVAMRAMDRAGPGYELVNVNTKLGTGLVVRPMGQVEQEVEQAAPSLLESFQTPTESANVSPAPEIQPASEPSVPTISPDSAGGVELGNVDGGRRAGTDGQAASAIGMGELGELPGSLPATPIATLQSEIAKVEPFTPEHSDLLERLQVEVSNDAKAAIDGGSMPVYSVGGDNYVAISPSAQNPGMVQVSRYSKGGILGDSQYKSIEQAIQSEGLADRPRLDPAAAESVISAAVQEESKFQERKTPADARLVPVSQRNVQNSETPAAGAQTETAPVEARTEGTGQPTATAELPGAGSPAVQPEGVTLYRGVPKDAAGRDTVGGALFMSPDKGVAENYAGKDGQVSEETRTFTNLLSAENWMAAKEKLGLEKSASMGDLVNAAREAGHDGVSFVTTNGREYIAIDQKQPTKADDGFTQSLNKDSSWVIRNKETGEVVMETFDKARVDALNAEKYEAVPIQQHLGELNQKAEAPAQVDQSPSLDDLNSGKAFVDSTKAKIAEWVSKATNNGTREMDRNWERNAVKRFVDANVNAMLVGKQTGGRAAAKIAIGKAQTFADLSTAVEKFAQPDSRLIPKSKRAEAEPAVQPMPSAAAATESVAEPAPVSTNAPAPEVQSQPVKKADPRLTPKSKRKQAEKQVPVAVQPTEPAAPTPQELPTEAQTQSADASVDALAEAEAPQETAQQATEPTEATPAAEATAILDAAEVTGKERIDALKDVKKGDITTEELKAAYPAKDSATQEAKPYDLARAQELQNSITEGELILKTGRLNDRKQTPDQLAMVKKSVESAKAKLAAMQPEAGDAAMFSRQGQRDSESVAPVSRNPAETPLYEAMRQLSRFEDSFQTGRSDAQDLAQIAEEMTSKNPDLGDFKVEKSTALHQGNRKPTLALKVTLPNGNEVKLLDIFDADKAKPFVVIGNSEAGQGVGGATAYQIAFAWAHNNGKTMKPDPAGLTVINRLRRTEAMISSAMQFGTTKHLEPHQDQYVALLERVRDGGKEPEDTHYSSRPDIYNELEALKEKFWTSGDSAPNIASNVQHLLEASTQLAYAREPAIRNFEVSDGVLRVRDGREGSLSLANDALAESSDATKILGVVLRPAVSGVGASTLRRAAVSGSIARAVQRNGQGDAVSENNGNQSPDVAALQAIRGVLGKLDLSTPEVGKNLFYSRGNGARTGLTQSQFTTELAKAFGANVAERLQDKGVVVPLADQSKLPAHVVPFLRDGDIVHGFYDPKTNRTYAVLENLTPEMVKGLVMHEVGVHYGFEAMLGEAKYNNVMKRLDVMRKAGSKAVKEAYAQAVKNSVNPSQHGEETLAYLVQSAPEMGLVKEIIAKIKAFLYSEFGIGGKYLTEADLTMLARAAVDHSSRTVDGGSAVPAFMRGTNGAVTNPNDVVGNQGGRSADDTTPGALSPVEAVKQAAHDAFTVYQKRTGAEGDAKNFEVDDNDTPVPFRAGAAERELENLGWDIGTKTAAYAGNDASQYITARKLVAASPEYGDEYVTAKIRIANHGNTTKATDRPDVNIAPGEDIVWDIEEKLNQKITDEGYELPVSAPSDARLGYAIATEQAQSGKPSDGSGRNPTTNEYTAPDSGGADISFARSQIVGKTNRNTAVNDAVQHLNDRFNAPGTLNWWHKSVGTQYNLAQRNPAFKKVFDSVQNFINDTSYYAAKASDFAPTLIPKLDSWKDIFRRSITSADSKAIATPIFEGTLTWGRDESGKLVKSAMLEEKAKLMTADQKSQKLLKAGTVQERTLKMWRGLPVDQYEAIINGKYEREMLKPGVVFTEPELKDKFNLTPAQIGLYKEFRAATDKSLTDLTVSHMLKLGGKDTQPIADQALEAKSVRESSQILAEYLRSLAAQDEARSEVLMDTADRIIEMSDKAEDLIKRGYAPLSRFGQYTVDVIDNGERVYFGMFESKLEANKMAAKMQGNYPESEIQQGTISEEEYKLFAGVTPETLELFGEMMGLDAQGGDAKNVAFQEYLKAAKSNRSAMKRLIQRKGIAGFSEDAGRVLAGFIYSNARQTSANLHAGDITQATADIPKGQGQIKDAAIKLALYVQNPQEEAQAIRGLMFAQYIGGSVASAMVNLTQPFTMTLPWLSQYGGITKASKQMAAAVSDALKQKTGDAKLDAALKHAEEEGIVSPQEVHQLQGQAAGKGALQTGDGTKMGEALALANNNLSRVQLAWGKLFGVAEQFNRRTTFIAAYRTAVDQKIADPIGFAAKAIAETQGVYNKGNKPAWARSAIGATLFTFKQFSISYMEMISRMALGPKATPESRMAALYAMGILVMFAGVGGLPGADDMDDILSGLMQSMGYNFDSQAARRKFLTELVGTGGQRFIENGLSGLPGVPIDVSGRLGLGNLIPGTGLFTKKTDHTRDVAELAGPVADLSKRAFEASGLAIKGQVGEATLTAMPLAVRNLAKGYDMANMGMYRDQSGKKVIDTTATEAAFKAIGFQPNTVKQVQDASGEAIRTIGLNKMRESEIADKWAKGMFEKDKEKVQDARDDLAQWNRDNPDMPIRINYNQIFKRLKEMNLTKEQRLAKTAPKEIRAQVARELAEAR